MIITIQQAIDRLKEALREDEAYRQGWQSNISMAYIDEIKEKNGYLSVNDRLIANLAADNFLHQLVNTK